MKIAVIGHVDHVLDSSGKLYAYGPYVKEINIWSKHVDELIVVAPMSRRGISKIDSPYEKDEVTFVRIPSVSYTSLIQVLRSLFVIPWILARLWITMYRANHIHLRCPGSIGLLGCFVQIFFPKKPKTAKYAGNWDPQSKQPLSYRIQKRLLSNTFLTRNMKVLVYGEWADQTKNIVPFFTATYRDNKIEKPEARYVDGPIRFMFAGSLSIGKRPVYALELVSSLAELGIACHIDFYGDGEQREALEAYIDQHKLDEIATLHGNETPETVELAYKKSHFMILPSKSEGWPKVVAEAMFWGCVPVATRISCVPWMLAEGDRGILLDLDKDKDTQLLYSHISDKKKLADMASRAHDWSKQYTLDKFEFEIRKFLQ